MGSGQGHPDGTNVTVTRLGDDGRCRQHAGNEILGRGRRTRGSDGICALGGSFGADIVSSLPLPALPPKD